MRVRYPTPQKNFLCYNTFASKVQRLNPFNYIFNYKNPKIFQISQVLAEKKFLTIRRDSSLPHVAGSFKRMRVLRLQIESFAARMKDILQGGMSNVWRIIWRKEKTFVAFGG